MSIRLTICIAVMAALCALLLILPAEAVMPLFPVNGPSAASTTLSFWHMPPRDTPRPYQRSLATADTPTATSTLTPSPTPTPCEDPYEPDDVIPNAIGVGETQNHTFCPWGDMDQETFLAKAGHAYRVYTSNLAPGVDTELTVTVPGIPDPLYNDDRQSGDLSSFVEFMTPLGPDVTVLVVVNSRGPYGPSYTYQLSVQEYIPTPTITPTPDLRDAYEPDETTPPQIVVGTTQRHNFFPFGDIDYVWFAAGAGRLYRASTTGVETMLIPMLVEAIAPREELRAQAPASYSEVFIRVPADRDMKAIIEIRSRGPYGGDQVYDLTVEEVPLTATPTRTPVPTLEGTPVWLPLALRPAPTPTPTPTRTPTQNPYPVPTETITATPTRTLPPTITPTLTPSPTATPHPTPPNCYEALRNTGFETDEAWQWGNTPHPGAYTTAMAFSGARAARLGIEPWSANIESFSSVRQTLTLPRDATSVTLKFWWWRRTEEAVLAHSILRPTGALHPEWLAASRPAPDVHEVVLLNPLTYETLRTLWQGRANDRTWVQMTFDLTEWRGRQVVLYFNATNDGLGGRTWLYLDDVTVQVCLPAAVVE